MAQAQEYRGLPGWWDWLAEDREDSGWMTECLNDERVTHFQHSEQKKQNLNLKDKEMKSEEERDEKALWQVGE